MATEIIIKDDEGVNFVLWIIFLCLLGSGVILMSNKYNVGLLLVISAFIFWLSVVIYTKRKIKTIKK